MAQRRRSGTGGTPDMEEIRRQVHRDVATAGDRAFDSPPRGGYRPPRVMSEVERHGVSPMDTEATSPLGVGASATARGEHIASRKEDRGRRRIGHEGPARRPVGIAAPEQHTGVGRSGPIDEESPFLPSGDQAG
ncbi:hypothetical protein Sme01_51760 [Sphaerisporangium melleum]|uniref:Uncharacterized protein n=1 Tax=Sphaerisporangium melleum TaxID=321316 RepID=A0A917QYI3_9ACTN|nr:hypothetical protein [Sphaerisporangium melleum]GGK76023.1 hypothetical protein GCM10007964_18520 [Sphaerisporangium melleum]GII72700.1 hypothetical protein Sme01_51760 [Sphaerisporangium melleum]